MKITEAFERGEFAVTAEVGPPKGIHIEGLLEEAKTYLSDITAVNVTDNQSSVMRLGSLGVCKALKDEGLTLFSSLPAVTETVLRCSLIF